MEGISQEINETNFLPEILQKIFQNLNIQDLSRAATVNKLWNEVAMCEQKKRGPQIKVMPVSDVNVYELRAKPYVTFMFAGLDRLPRRTFFELNVLKKYRDHFPNYLVVLRFDVVMLDENLVTCNVEISEGGILSLLIPEYRDLKIRVAHTVHFHDDVKFLNEFLPENSNSPATFIVLADYGIKCEHLFELLEKSMTERQQRYTLWGGAFAKAPIVAINGEIRQGFGQENTERVNSHIINYWRTRCIGMFAMSITGTSLKSWSIVISCLMTKDDFDKKLMDFRDQLQFKQRMIGIVCGPPDLRFFSDSGSSFTQAYVTFHEMMQSLKQIFPDVPFTGVYDVLCDIYCYGMKSKIDDPNQNLKHKTSYSLMILTFD